MSNHMEAAIEAGNRELAVYQAVPVCAEDYEKSLDKMHEGDAVEWIIKKAIPHIRAMIAEEIEAENAKRHRDYRDGRWDNGYTPEWSAGMGTAAQIVEGNRP